MKHVLLVDDHAIVRAGLQRLLATASPCQISEAATGQEALAALRTHRPDLVILDLNLPGLGGLELLRRMLLEDARTRILVLTMHAEPLYAARALEAGASGYISKNAAPEELLSAIQRVIAGGHYVEAEIAQEIVVQRATNGHPMRQLNERELEIMRLLAAGRSLQEVADALGIAYKTAANVCTQIKAKLGVTRTADLVRLAAEFGVT